MQKVDTAFNIFFLIHFIIRVSWAEFLYLNLPSLSLHFSPFQFMKTSDKLWFLLELYSFIDYLTVPQCLMSSYFDRTWIGEKRLTLI